METTENQPPTGNGAGIDLKITVRDKDGNIIDQQCKEGDIYLYNWAVLIASMLKCGFANGTAKSYFAIRKTDGVQLTGPSTMYGASPSGPAWSGGGKVCLGASNQTPGIRDFNLAAPVVEVSPSIPFINQDGNTLKIVVSATASFAAQTTLCECGLAVSLPWVTGADTTTNRVLITRDIFDAVTVPTGGTITVQFELWFNAMPA